MKILVNGLSARLGGGQTYILNLLKRVPQGEWKIFLLCTDTLDLTHLPSNVERVEIGVNLENPFRRAIWEYLHLGALAKKMNADLLFSPGGLLPYGLPENVKTAVTFQNMLPFDKVQRKRYPPGLHRLRNWLLERGLTRAMRKADLVVFISHFAREYIRSALGSLKSKTVVIPHGVDPRFFPSAPPLPLPAYAPTGEYFLYVSFLDYYKSQIEVVQAFAELRARGITQATLVLAGAENPTYGEALRREIKRLNLEKAVILLGNISHRDLPALYQHAHMNLFASCTENCPNILLEIMASGRPALISGRGPMQEFGGNDVTYFNPGDVTELTQKWAALLSNKNQAHALAAQAQTRVAAMTWEKTAEATWSAIGQTVGMKP